MKKYFTKNASTNIVILAISYLSFPLSLIFKKIGFNANFITFLSFTFGLVSIFFFLFIDIYILFVFFFYLSVILDFCDGQVARMTNSINKTEFDLDINVDLVKNCIIFICIGLLYNNSIYWVQTCSLIFLYSFFIKTHLYISKLEKINSKTKKNTKDDFKINHFKIIFLSINAHTFLLIPICLIDFKFGLVINSYMILLFFIYSLKNIRKLNSYLI